jgi:glucosamine-phosphate N-acetyltransferase
MEYNIRKLNENDYEKYLVLINNLRPTQFSKEDFLNILEKININSSIWIMEINNELVSTGTILYEYKFIHNISKLAHIEDICVDEKYRGQKYGEKLINYSE